jgi:cyclase
VEQARAYDAAGADELMFLDITASHENRGTILDVVARTADVCFMPLSVGGGIRTVEDARRLLLAGADKISINTAAVENRDLIAAAPTPSAARPVVADRRQAVRDGAGEVFTYGGRNATGLDVVDYAAEVVARARARSC